MTTPKRYEETARRLMQNPLGHGLPCVCAQCEDRAVKLVRAAAREAQARVLDLALNAAPSDEAEASIRVLVRRLDSGEDL